MGCKTVWVTFRGLKGPKKPTAGGSGSGPRQYVQLGGSEKVLAHRLAWVFARTGRDFTLLTDPGVEASHLCGNSLCCNGEHIAMEPRSVNQSRSYCLHTWTDTTVSPPNVFDVCLHFPKCLKRGSVWEKVVRPWTVSVLAREADNDSVMADGDGDDSLILPYLPSEPGLSDAGSEVWRASLPSEPESASCYEVDDPSQVEVEEAQAESSEYEGGSVFGDEEMVFDDEPTIRF